MRDFWFVAMAIIFASDATIAKATDSGPIAEAVRQPTDNWVVEFNDAQCVARRAYGTTSAPLNLMLKEPPLGDVMQVGIVEQRHAGSAVEREARLQFDDGVPLNVRALQFQPKGSKLRTTLVNLPLAQFSTAISAKTLRMKTGTLNVALALTDVASLRRCGVSWTCA